MDILIGMVIGMVIMDAMWAWRLGIPQAMYAMWKLRRNGVVDIEEYKQY